VRVMGGAYGGYSSLDLASGLLLLLSYRDPNLERTIEVYRKVSNYLKSATVSDEEIHRAIIGTIGEVDAYQLPDAKGFNALMNELTGYTQEVRQTIRNQILATDADAFRRLGAMIEEAMQALHDGSAVRPGTYRQGLTGLADANRAPLSVVIRRPWDRACRAESDPQRRPTGRRRSCSTYRRLPEQPTHRALQCALDP